MVSIRIAVPRCGSAVVILALAAGLSACHSTGQPNRPASSQPTAGGQTTAASVVEKYRLPPAPRGGRTTLVMAINDVYRIAGLENGTAGGLARVRTLRRELELEAPELLLTHAGDAIFPSFMSRTYDGEQMIDVLNLLDGKDDDSLDERMFLTFGNHEFDKSDLDEAGILDDRVQQSRFRWLAANLEFKAGTDGNPLVAAPQLLPWTVVESGGIRVGIFGLLGPELVDAEYADVGDYQAAARRATAALRQLNAEVVIGLTHHFVEDDCALLSALGDEGPDLILGGHEHAEQRFKAGERWLLKADADARSATVVRISIDETGRLSIEPAPRIELAGESPRDDPLVEERVAQWQKKHDESYCTSHNQAPGCLNDRVGVTRTVLVAEESQIRAYETSLGDWLTDLMLAAFRDQGAQVAFINSGSLRLNQNVVPGPISLADMEGIFQYSSPLRLLRIDGATLQKVVDRAVEQWPGSGHWLQIAGFSYLHDSTAATATELMLLTADGPRAVKADDQIMAVTVDYLVNPKRDQDGYTMLSQEQVVAETGDLKRIALAALAAVGEGGIAPKTEDRIRLANSLEENSGGIRLCADVD